MGSLQNLALREVLSSIPHILAEGEPNKCMQLGLRSRAPYTSRAVRVPPTCHSSTHTTALTTFRTHLWPVSLPLVLFWKILRISGRVASMRSTRPRSTAAAAYGWPARRWDRYRSQAETILHLMAAKTLSW